MTNPTIPWEKQVETLMQTFAFRYSGVYAKKDREISACFEIGCFLSLIEFYERQGFLGDPRHLQEDESYRYLTTPSGNPNNFSYMLMWKETVIIEIRQQVRIASHVGNDIAFTPDIVVLPCNASIHRTSPREYAGGKRGFFYVDSESVIAAHECKSMTPFPELLVSFIGTVVAAHKWLDRSGTTSPVSPTGIHLAPCLFVGGTARALHLKMIRGLKNALPMNIVVGMHSGTWDLLGDNADLRLMDNPLV